MKKKFFVWFLPASFFLAHIRACSATVTWTSRKFYRLNVDEFALSFVSASFVLLSWRFFDLKVLIYSSLHLFKKKKEEKKEKKNL